MDEFFRKRRVEHGGSMGGRGFDKISQHVIMLYLQGVDPGFPGKLRLHRRDHPAPLVAQFTRFIQLGHKALGHKTAIAGQKRRFGNQRLIQQRDQVIMPAHQPKRIAGALGQFIS